MKSNNSDARGAQGPTLVRLWRIARRPVETPRRDTKQQRRIRIERAVQLIVRTRCDTRTACRAVGLHDHAAAYEVRRICDVRGIPRRRWWGTPLLYPKTAEPHPDHVKPRAR
jgi:hypothetical protein